ncbi:phage tail protein [Citrobacter freundii ATCC 8090 = MTCC 1658 = NBRC 12681]|uniref:phage tail protein n=1 Tax=Citrobacter freundii TaxID=546 RepID=UPI000299B7DC|nr:phage tail protein [Citrobacter freundii]EKS58829.1 putative tail assembly protein [Citrobacter freundii ATCC 8090 = MTCC 1658 = NBRC 12681]EXF29673.1 tail protein [Citrobacter freundii RLS1]KFC00670.1 phage tail protein [Citrobacter freundii ATCC 8090 = MTCC 1658 = NBRC 12681]QIH68098.1 phage tail protein [Citrobacter freundii ATCC 8090 = MTCC 1658 = NBRC 12681]WOY56228.1 phage tail protein [Citrobacter freundii]
MMMVYGMFVFELRTLPHQQLQQNKSWRHVKNERINRSASWQYIGAGEDQITLSGVLYPEITGGEVSLTVLTTQAYTGRPWPLIDGTGQIYGMYVITGLQTTRSELDRYGKAKKIEFSISFQRCDEDLRERLQSSSVGDLLTGLKDGANTAYSSINSTLTGLV